MSEQAKILEEIQAMVMEVLKSGMATEAQGERLDVLEESLYEQPCFKEQENSDEGSLGEQIARLFFTNKKEEAIAKMKELEIQPEEFFGFAHYHFDEEPLVEMFTEPYMADVSKEYFQA